MFQNLSERLESVFTKLRGKGKLREEDVEEALREVRRALLEADVNFGVTRDFVARVRESAVGRQALGELSTAQQVVGIVHEELVKLLGGGEGHHPLDLRTSPVSTVMLVGLQGAGKTSFAAKLAGLLRRQGRRPLLVGADIQRPAAMDQLEVLGRQIDIPVFLDRDEKDVGVIAESGRADARARLCDLMLLDTAGRLHVDEALMGELEGLNARLRPDEILLVVDAMTGQEAVRVAEAFKARLPLTGVLLSKLDGDARGGAALSVRAVTGLPIKFVGVGETVKDVEAFHPDRMAGRILGMGDVLSLVEKVQQEQDLAEAQQLEQKLRKQGLDLEDMLGQIEKLQKMGPLNKILGMLPGMSKLQSQGFEADEGQLTRVRAIIQSMTRQERRRPEIIDGSRRRRIARGSGTTVQDVNQLLRQHGEMKKMMKTLGRMKGRGRVPGPMRGGPGN
ncbi:MAG: signal recognition particle protein [Candidatus Krumholzibacteriia bacterium]|nr:signal recognition particle protein [Candidatus Latescibacterota bacterium]